MSLVHAARSGYVTKNFANLFPSADGTVFLDSSTNAATLTGHNSVIQNDTESPYASGGSALFGSSKWVSSDGTNCQLGSGDFTVECWVKESTSGYNGIFGIWSNDDSDNSWLIYQQGTDFAFYYDTGSFQYHIGSPATSAANRWVHLAVTRSGNTFDLWIDGTSAANWTDSNTISSSARDLEIGRNPAGAYFPGYISDCRVVIGTAVYTSTFTPPTSKLSAVSGTEYLCHLDNYGVGQPGGSNTNF